MIYVGLIHFNDAPDRTQELSFFLESYTNTTPTVIRKNSFTFCYGKLKNAHDVDDIWESKSSVLVGRIFHKVQHCSFEKKDFNNLPHINKEHVLKEIWGKYVYINNINNNERTSRFEIIVDPSGQLPFFYYLLPDGNVLFSSDIEIIVKFLGKKPEYNWSYLYSYLIYGNNSAIQTPFKSIYELPPGCCLQISKDERKIEPFWDPLSSYETPMAQEKDAVNALITTLKPWIKPYENVCVSLSGGLDSSSLVYCLKKIVENHQTLTALNYFHTSIKSSNELIHARKVCQETGIELLEIDVSHSLPFDPSNRKLPLNPNKPFPGLITLKTLENISDHLPSTGTCAFISGHGSDHIFMRPPSKKALSDYFIEKGLKGSKVQLKKITQFYRDSFLSIFKENVKSLGTYFFYRRLGKRNFNKQDKKPNWIKPGVFENTSSHFRHPIYRHLPSRVLPGKYEQIDAFYEGIASIHMEMNRVHPTYYPFLYEPVVEFALSFPTYDLFEKGYDRYPLRKAVSHHFKTETVWRRDKSQTTGVFQLGVKKNLKHVLDICLEGQFAKQDLIDKNELHETIMLIGNGDTKHLWSLIYIASVEIFLNYWGEKC